MDSCALIRNAKNGRSMYDDTSSNLFGASPAGEAEYVWTNAGYIWHFKDLVTGSGFDVTNLAAERMF